MGSFIQTLISFFKWLVSPLFGRPRAVPAPQLVPAAIPNPRPDPSRAWQPCAWCDGLMTPDDCCTLQSGEAVHSSCRMKRLDQRSWRFTRRVMSQELLNTLRPVYPALGQTKEVEDLISRLHPEKDVSLEDAFGVLRALEQRVRGLKTHDLRMTTAALASISQARMEIRSFLKNA